MCIKVNFGYPTLENLKIYTCLTPDKWYEFDI